MVYEIIVGFGNVVNIFLEMRRIYNIIIVSFRFILFFFVYLIPSEWYETLTRERVYVIEQCLNGYFAIRRSITMFTFKPNLYEH